MNGDRRCLAADAAWAWRLALLGRDSRVERDDLMESTASAALGISLASWLVASLATSLRERIFYWRERLFWQARERVAHLRWCDQGGKSGKKRFGGGSERDRMNSPGFAHLRIWGGGE
jgi:hypothetical protein